MPRRGAGRSFRFTPTILAAIGLTLAIASAVTPQQQAPLGGLATRIALPLPDSIVIAAMASLSLASLIFTAMAFAASATYGGENEYEIYHEPRKIPPWVVVALLLMLRRRSVLGGAVISYEQHQPYPPKGRKALRRRTCRGCRLPSHRMWRPRRPPGRHR